MKRLVFIALIAVACGGEDGPPPTLSEWGLFSDMATQTPAEEVVHYDIISPLFSDYALKFRYVRLPEGTQIHQSDDGHWQFPVGTVIAKTFTFPADLRDASSPLHVVETRLLVLEDSGWESYVYLWDDDNREARYHATGQRVPVQWIDEEGNDVSITYRVPNVVQCVNCHGGSAEVLPLGPKTQQLDHDFDDGAGSMNQLERFRSHGLLDSSFDVTPDPFVAPEDDDIDARARAYLDANCAHCHREDGAAAQSGLWLGADIDDPLALGICKVPVAAGRGAGGRRFDIVPGAPEESVIVFRMESEEAGVKMPELPTVLSHAEGVTIVSEWIAAMEGGCE